MKLQGRADFVVLFSLLLLPLAGCSTANPDSYESRPFFQNEQQVETHGRKTWFDHLVEFDPGGLDVDLASDYQQRPPAVIAVMPFTDRGSAQYTVDKIPFTFRNKKERDQWAWTDAQRLRRAFVGYLSQREFTVVNPIAVDAVLKEHGIHNDEQLQNVSVLKLGKWFKCDAVIFGQVNRYDAFYGGPLAGYIVGMTSRMVSTHDGETLMRTDGSRWNVDFMPALDLQDILINSVEALLQLRDVELARSEEEVARELVLRIPVSDKLRVQMAKSAIEKATESEDPDELSAAPQNVRLDTVQAEARPAPSTSEQRFLSAVAIGDDQVANADANDDEPVDQPTQHPKTASSWHQRGSGSYAWVSSQQRH